jgi:hypothetical protein
MPHREQLVRQVTTTRLTSDMATHVAEASLTNESSCVGSPRFASRTATGQARELAINGRPNQTPGRFVGVADSPTSTT